MVCDQIAQGAAKMLELAIVDYFRGTSTFISTMKNSYGERAGYLLLSSDCIEVSLMISAIKNAENIILNSCPSRNCGTLVQENLDKIKSEQFLNSIVNQAGTSFAFESCDTLDCFGTSLDIVIDSLAKPDHHSGSNSSSGHNHSDPGSNSSSNPDHPSSPSTDPPIEEPINLNNVYEGGSPGIKNDRVFRFNNPEGKIEVGGCNWDREGAIRQVFGTNNAEEVLLLLRMVLPEPAGTALDKITNIQCEKDSDCMGSQVCGSLLYRTSVGYYEIDRRCGVQYAWGTLQGICSQSYGGTQNLDYQISERIKSKGLIDCEAYGSNKQPLTGAQGLYGCVGTSFDTCYRPGAITSCCGCADWNVDSCYKPTPDAFVSSTLTSGQIRCGLKVAYYDGFFCNATYSSWNAKVLPFELAKKTSCPTAYTYPFDDKSATFTYTAKKEDSDMHIIACPERGGYKLSKIQHNDGYFTFEILNNCDQNIWPGLMPSTNPKKQGTYDRDDVTCQTNQDCYEGTNCDSRSKKCLWDLYEPYIKVGSDYQQVTPNNYRLEPGGSMQYRLPMIKGITPQKFIWSGGIIFRLDCPAEVDSYSCLGDCRDFGDKETFDGYRCNGDVGQNNRTVFNHYLRIEFNVGINEDGTNENFEKTVTFFNLQMIEPTLMIGAAAVPSNLIPEVLQA